jgi:hypothetical protein
VRELDKLSPQRAGAFFASLATASLRAGSAEAAGRPSRIKETSQFFDSHLAKIGKLP